VAQADNIARRPARAAKPEGKATFRTRHSLDPATLFGLAGAFALVATAMVLGGTPRAFLDLPAILIVVGGTLLVTTISFSLGDILGAQRVVRRSLFFQRSDPSQAALQVLSLADQARKKGVLALQDALDRMPKASFLYRGLNLAVDGFTGDDIDSILRAEISATVDRHEKSAAILRRAAEVAPAMGLIGTLVGLVQMLGNLEDPSTIGPSMAVALLTTFYGAIMANMLFLPLAAKLERNSAHEALVNNVYMLGAASVGRQENPRRLELMINTSLPPANRVRYFK